QKRPWPMVNGQNDGFAEFLLDEEQRARYRGRGKSTAKLTPLSPEDEMAARIPFFFSSEAPERYIFANVFGLHIFRLRGDGALTKSYSVDAYDGSAVLADYAGADVGRRILDALSEGISWNGNVSFLPGADSENPASFGYCLATDGNTEDAQDLWIFFRNEEKTAHVPAESLWELPFTTYKKHATRRARVGVLGLAEEYYINNHGFRDWDVILPKPRGVFRIACVGASTTEEGVTNDLTYPAILEALLNQRLEDNSVDVINCGISGMNSMKHRMRFPDYMMLEPDLLVVYIAANDICHQLLPRWISQADAQQKRLRRSRFITHYMNRFLLPSDGEMREAIARHSMSHLRYIIREAEKRDVKTALCSFAAPNPALLSRGECAYYDYLTMQEWGGKWVTFGGYLRILDMYNEALKRLCAEENALYIPVAEQLQGGAFYFGDICHLRNPGIQRKAEIIADALETQIGSVSREDHPPTE
ncbi:MAG TPA: hypothetical protein ENN29_04690, partial [Candidatus Hydrogenedentes bacterium]|nr:hypothetical protein [Candidatus Hydrogenedentota bacterium]